MSSESWSCNCMGPQNGEPYCPCMMNKLNIVKRNGRWVEPERDLGPVREFPYQPMPFSQKAPCLSAEHNPPTHLYIPPGSTYTHVCPACGESTTISPPLITFCAPDKSVIAPDFDMTTESFEPHSFSIEDDEDAFTAESDDEVLGWIKK